MEIKKYNLGTKVILKKGHPCGSNMWEIVRTGADIKIKCLGCITLLCYHEVDFDKKIKKDSE